MPKILIWRPKNENQAGHVAMTTDKYYISVWPARCLEEDGKKIAALSDGVEFVYGTKGCLVINQNVDRENEGDCDPDIEYGIDSAVGNEDINSVYEEFLCYNEINPEEVTLARGDEEYQEYKELVASLTREEAEDREPPQKSLSKTKYSISAELVSSKKNTSAPFYSSQQSCVSLAFNLVQMAWLKHRPDQPIPIVNHEGIENASGFSISSIFSAMASMVFHNKAPTQFAYKVPWFEREVVQRYVIAEDNANRPMLSIHFLTDYVNDAARGVIATFVLLFVLILLGWGFPVFRYLLVFAYFWTENDDRSFLSLFIFPLLIIASDYIFSWGVVVPTFIYHVCRLVYVLIKLIRISPPGDLVLGVLEMFVGIGRFQKYVEEVGYPSNGVVGLFKLFNDFRALEEPIN